MLIEILEEIFRANGYESHIIEFDEYHCQLFKKEDIDNFFIVLDKESISDEELEQLDFTKLYDTANNLPITNNAFEKNTTLIIGVQNSNIDYRIINQHEEDSYTFKKNIIVYSDVMINAFKVLVEDEYNIENLNTKLNDDALFEANKTPQNQGYTLLCTLFIKLPFLSFDREVKDIDNLSEIIEQRVENENLTDLYSKIIDDSIIVDNSLTYEKLLGYQLVKAMQDE
ncbi:MAG: hypothetical protein KU38_12025 [Sulfurovum sp. FS08-3]|nr:MAG: hypothetical protein KU38_12025 [Sulfurovum sp. FS08-3]